MLTQINLVLSEALRNLVAGDPDNIRKIWPLLANGRVEVFSGDPPLYAHENTGRAVLMSTAILEGFKACCPALVRGRASWVRIYGMFGHADVRLEEVHLVVGDTINLDFSKHSESGGWDE